MIIVWLNSEEKKKRRVFFCGEESEIKYGRIRRKQGNAAAKFGNDGNRQKKGIIIKGKS